MALTPVNMKIPTESEQSLKIWDRLEPMPYEDDFMRALRAEIHDALWMLTRQWQFGEFKGEDAGSPIHSDVELEIAPLSRIVFGQPETANVYGSMLLPNHLPMEAVVEGEAVPISLRDCLRWTVQLKNLIQEIWSSQPQSTRTSILNTFLKNYPLALPVAQPEKERWEADEELQSWLSLFSNRLLDAGKFYSALKGQTTLNALSLFINPTIPVTQKTNFEAVIQELRRWWEGLYFQAAPTADGISPFWDKKDMDYEFGISAPMSGNTRQVFTSSEYSLGTLDWHAFVEGNTVLNNNAVQALNNNTLIANESTLVSPPPINLFPNPAQFPGMPAFRFWEFENGSINLANMEIGNNDLAKVLFAEFALVYSNDWQLVPITLPFGHVCRVKKISVTDVFGITTKVFTASNNNNIGINGWSMFGVSNESGSPNGGLLLPSVAVGVLESPPLEQVYFVKSEWDNVLWAIEKIIPGFFGQGISASESFERLKQYLRNKYPAPSSNSSNEQSSSDAAFIYRLLQETPETQFPYFSDQNNWSLELLKRTITGVADNSLVQPNTATIKQNILTKSTIPEVGLRVERIFQRARATNGAVVTWLGRKKMLDKSAPWSRLEFDILTSSH